MNTGLPARTRADLLICWRTPFAFHFVMQALAFALFTPLIGWVANRIVSSTGEQVVSNFDIVGFVLSPAGVVGVLLVAALTIGLLFAEFAGHTWIAGHAIARRPVTLASTLSFVALKLPALILLSAQVFVRLLLLLTPFAAVVALIWFTRFAGQDINYYLADNPPEWRRARLVVALLLAAYAALAAWQLARWLYALPIMIYEGLRPRRALERSAQMTRGRVPAIITPLAGWWLLLTGVALLLTLLGRMLSDTGLDWAGIDLQRVLPLVALFLAVSIVGGFVYGALQLAGHQFLVTRMYAEQLDATRWTITAQVDATDTAARSVVRTALVPALAVAALALGVAAFLFARLDLKSDVAITAHRGASITAPENSMAAFRAALEAGADYVELDVQRTRDGTIAVLHDGDLMRMAGDPRKLAELALQDFAHIDIGRKRDAKFAGEFLPTLVEVIALARGHMKINVELKYNVPDAGLAQAVVELLRREDFIDEVVITSLDYAALRQVEVLEPRLQTGHIITAAVGDVARTSADFVSLNSARATPALLRRAHSAGKAVHVWTVNKPEVMLRMIERGVDNIITDDPALLARVMRERNALSNPGILGLRLRVLFGRPPAEVVDAGAVPVL